MNYVCEGHDLYVENPDQIEDGELEFYNFKHCPRCGVWFGTFKKDRQKKFWDKYKKKLNDRYNEY